MYSYSARLGTVRIGGDQEKRERDKKNFVDNLIFDLSRSAAPALLVRILIARLLTMSSYTYKLQ